MAIPRPVVARLTLSSLAPLPPRQEFEFMPGQKIPAVPSDREFYVKLCKDTPRFVGEFGIRPNPITDRDGGLDGILDGFELMKNGKVSASKLVYKVASV